MVDLEDKLKDWKIRSAKVRRIGEQLRELQITSTDLHLNHINSSNETCFAHVDGREALALADEARKLHGLSKRTNGDGSFDEIALRQFANDSTSLQRYLRWVGDSPRYFKVPESKITPKMVAELVDGMLLPEMKEPAAVYLSPRNFPRGRGLAHKASIARYHDFPPRAIKKREELLRHYKEWDNVATGSMLAHMYEVEKQKLLHCGLEAYVSFGLISSSEMDNILRIDQQTRDFDLRLDREASEGKFTDFRIEGVPNHLKPLIENSRRKPFVLRFDLKDDIFSYADGRTNSTQVRENSLLISQDRETGKFRFYLGDAYIAGIHEKGHILHWILSSNMPAGLDNDPRGLSLANYPQIEGLASWAEYNVGLPWLSENRERLDMSQGDLEAASIGDVERTRGFRARMFFATHRMADPFGAARKTFFDTGNPFYKSSDNFPQEKLADLMLFHTYDLGLAEIRAIWNDVREHEEERLGSRASADSFIEEHRPLIVRGMFTGGWSLAEMRPWMFSHYLPKLYKALKAEVKPNVSVITNIE